MNAKSGLDALNSERHDALFVNSLPADEYQGQHPRQVSNCCYSLITCKDFKAPYLIAYAAELAQEFGLDNTDINSAQFLDFITGKKLPPHMKPYSMCYGGHQFGNWAGQLGDGRAINLGEFSDNKGLAWTFQVKGAGLTPYSRHADGLAVLRSSVREFLCSEAMYHLGVPTTRALCLLGTGETVTRDMFYDGNPQDEPGAIVCRLAPSFLRFGNFEIHAARGEHELLRQLCDFTIKQYFPEISTTAESRYIQMYERVCTLTREMLVHWMRVGFVHGVMNTDNMSILGLTIDYGPYGWLEEYDPDWTPNTTDAQSRRYRFSNQPAVALWNLAQLANALYPLVNDASPFEQALQAFQAQYQQDYNQMMANKLGLDNLREDGDIQLIKGLPKILQQSKADMTLFFRKLALLGKDDLDSISSNDNIPEVLQDAFYIDDNAPGSDPQLQQWLLAYLHRSAENTTSPEVRIARMNSVNPLYVLRNYLAQLAIDQAENGDFQLIEELQEVLRNPYTEQEGKAHLCEKRPDWARSRPGCSMLSCSS